MRVPEIAAVMAAFGNMCEADLLRRFKHGRTAYVMSCGTDETPGIALDLPHYPCWPNLRTIYETVIERIAAIEQRYKGFVGGRPRGLASSARIG